MFLMEDVNSGLVALPQVKVTEADTELAVCRLVNVQSPPNLHDPAIVEPGEVRKCKCQIQQKNMIFFNMTCTS